MRWSRRRWGAVAGLVLVAPIVTTYLFYLRDMRRAHERVRARGTVIESPYGNIEFTEGGKGPDVLVIHGSGGGYDQGALIARVALGDGFHWIAPSRFGYLRSTFREGATFDDQAHAYAHLLDHLGIDRVAVVTISHGGPSALLFALLHPHRVSSLTLISAGVAPASSEAQLEANERGGMLTKVFKYDFVYWALTTFFERQFMNLMGANDDVVAGLTPSQHAQITNLIEYMNPVSLRSAGAAFDNQAALPGARIAKIESPTLIIHAEDDALQLFHNAEFAAATIPGARLMRFQRGGHVVVSVEQDVIQEAVRRHILEHVGASNL